jgi:ATP-dependent DNA ligase
MLSSSIRRWPTGGEWVMQPKWDGFRLLVDVDRGGRLRAWSRHGTNLTARLGSLLECFGAAPPDTVFDGELVALSDCDGSPVQDFATVTRAVFTGNPAATERLRFVAFDLLRLDGQDFRTRPWRQRDEHLRAGLPMCDRVRTISSQPASPEAHEAIVRLGFEGTVLKRPGSTYRVGRHAAWVKHKARHLATGTLLAVRQGRDGKWHAYCDVEGRRVTVLAGAPTAALIGCSVELAYSRLDANGGLREARITTAVPF